MSEPKLETSTNEKTGEVKVLDNPEFGTVKCQELRVGDGVVLLGRGENQGIWLTKNGSMVSFCQQHGQVHLGFRSSKAGNSDAHDLAIVVGKTGVEIHTTVNGKNLQFDLQALVLALQAVAFEKA